MQILSIGEILWDVIDGQEFLGGAPLNFAVALQRLGHSVGLVSAVGSDVRGERAFRSLFELGISAEFIRIRHHLPTGAAFVATDPDGNATFSIPRPAAFDDLDIDDAAMSRIEADPPRWLYFGTLSQINPPNKARLRALVKRFPRMKGFYDINLREGHWNLPLVQDLSTIADIIKLNEDEARLLFRLNGYIGPFSIQSFCRQWSNAYAVDTICVTRGGNGCAVFSEDALQFFPGYSITVLDSVGAGDAFAAAFLHGTILKWPIPKLAALANALGALVASRLGPTPKWYSAECLELISGCGATLNEIAEDETRTENKPCQ